VSAGDQGLGRQDRIPCLLIERAGRGLEQPQLGFRHPGLPALEGLLRCGETAFDAQIGCGGVGRHGRFWGTCRGLGLGAEMGRATPEQNRCCNAATGAQRQQGAGQWEMSHARGSIR
jgi:hypothetical protein